MLISLLINAISYGHASEAVVVSESVQQDQVLKSEESQSGQQDSALKGYAFSPQTVIDLAKKLAQSPMQPVEKAPKALIDMDYSMYRKINFQQNQAVWGNTPTKFSVQLFAPGFLFKDLVTIDVVENGRAFPLNVSADSFT
ncbi:MAG: glucan biosynthesis protein, partial [Marinomonas primoryensis]